jgi:transposase
LGKGLWGFLRQVVPHAAGQRFVPVRSIDNQAELMRHRTRELLAGQRTALLNALRGHLAEIGLVAPQGAQHAYGLKRMVAEAEVPSSLAIASWETTGSLLPSD